MGVGTKQNRKNTYRGVAQFGSATGLGPVGRGFKSCHPDHFLYMGH